MYKRHTGQVSMLESPEMFGSLPLDPNNDWIKLSKFVPWREFDLKYADNFRSKKGQRACDSRMALGSVLIKIHYKGMSDEDLTKEIAMNPYLQYFLGLREYRYECPFDASMMTRFRQRISAEMLAWVNDEIIGRRAAAEKKEEDHKDDETIDLLNTRSMYFVAQDAMNATCQGGICELPGEYNASAYTIKPTGTVKIEHYAGTNFLWRMKPLWKEYYAIAFGYQRETV